MPGGDGAGGGGRSGLSQRRETGAMTRDQGKGEGRREKREDRLGWGGEERARGGTGAVASLSSKCGVCC